MKRVNNGNLILLLLCLCSFGLLLTGCKKSDFTFAPYEVEGQKKDTGLEIDEEMTLDGYWMKMFGLWLLKMKQF